MKMKSVKTSFQTAMGRLLKVETFATFGQVSYAVIFDRD